MLLKLLFHVNAFFSFYQITENQSDNPLTPKSDQHSISPFSVTLLSESSHNVVRKKNDQEVKKVLIVNSIKEMYEEQ